MKKHTLGRAAGFVAAIGATTALVAGGVSMTGAYFQDEESGNFAATTGEVDVSVTGPTALSATFDDLMPGAAGDNNTYTFTNTGTDAVDYYMGGSDWKIGGGTPGRAGQPAGSSISNGIITFDGTATGPAGTSYEWDDIQTPVANGTVISYEWNDGAGNACLGGGVPRMFVQGGAFNTWDDAPATPTSCGTDPNNDGWNTVTRTVQGVTAGPAGNVAVVNDHGSRVIQFRNVTIGGVSLTNPTNQANLCSLAEHYNFEANLGDGNWFRVCDDPGRKVLVAQDVPAGQSRNITVALRLNANAQNTLANKVVTGELSVVATQPNAAPTGQADQSGNDDA